MSADVLSIVREHLSKKTHRKGKTCLTNLLEGFFAFFAFDFPYITHNQWLQHTSELSDCDEGFDRTRCDRGVASVVKGVD